MPNDYPPASSASKGSPTEDLPTPAGLPDDLAVLAEEEHGSTDPDEIKPKSIGSEDPSGN
jgi:hypothetical protein